MNRNADMTVLRKAALALALAAVTATAQAGVKASTFSTANIATYTPAEALVPLTSTGATSLSFTLASAGKKVLTYSAECAVAAPTGVSNAWVELDIYVNGVVTAATATGGDAFCSSNGTPAHDGWVRASITIPIQAVAGNNTIQIKAQGSWNSAGFWIGDSALVIYD